MSKKHKLTAKEYLEGLLRYLLKNKEITYAKSN
jgi:hypothetical protein